MSPAEILGAEGTATRAFAQSYLVRAHSTLSVTAARLAQLVERETLNLKAAGSRPALGFPFFLFRHRFSLQRRRVERDSPAKLQKLDVFFFSASR